jgi:hypothetical protein
MAGEGEPTLDTETEHFLDLLNKKGSLAKKTLVTNGSLLMRMSDEYINNIDILSISLDTVDPEKFKILSKNGRLSDVIDGVIKIKKIKPSIYLKCGVVSASYNIDEIENIYRFCNNHGFEQLNIGPLGYHDKRLLPSVSRKNFLSTFLEKYRESKLPVVVARSGIDSYFQDLYPENETVRTNSDLLAYYKNLENNAKTSPVKLNAPSLNFSTLDVNFPGKVLQNQVYANDWKEHYTFLSSQLISKIDIQVPYCIAPWYNVVVSTATGIFSPCCIFACRFNGPVVQEIRENTVIGSDFLSLDKYYNSDYMQSLRHSMFNEEFLPQICKNCKSYQRLFGLNFVLTVARELNMNFRKLHIKDKSIISPAFTDCFDQASAPLYELQIGEKTAFADNPKARQMLLSGFAVAPMNVAWTNSERSEFAFRVLVKMRTFLSRIKMLLSGFAVAPMNVAWTNSERSEFAFRVPPGTEGNLSLWIDCMVFAPEQLGENQFADVKINGVSVTRLAFSKTQAERFEIRLPRLEPEEDGYMVHMLFSERRSPAELGLGKDLHRLGLGIFTLQVELLNS